MENLLHKCGQCNQTFSTEEEYLSHGCEATGVQPTHPLSMGKNFLAIQTEALKRGAAAAQDAGDEDTAASTRAHVEEINKPAEQ